MADASRIEDAKKAKTRDEVRKAHEDRGDQTERNLRNRALRKKRDYWGKPYPGRDKASWPRRTRG